MPLPQGLLHGTVRLDTEPPHRSTARRIEDVGDVYVYLSASIFFGREHPSVLMKEYLVLTHGKVPYGLTVTLLLLLMEKPAGPVETEPQSVDISWWNICQERGKRTWIQSLLYHLGFCMCPSTDEFGVLSITRMRTVVPASKHVV